MTEAELQATIIEAAKWGGWGHYHTRDSRRSNPGFPDLILIRDGVMLAWELKSARGIVTADQVRWLDALSAVEGVEARVIRPVDLDWAVNQLTRST